MASERRPGHGGHCRAAQPHCLDPGSWSPQEARRLRTIAEDLGLYIAGFHIGAPDLLGEPAHEPSIMAPFQMQRSARIDLVRRGIDFAQELGAPIISFGSGPLPPHMPPAAGLDHLVNGLLRCLEHAAKASIRIGLEPEPGHLVHSYSAYIDLWNCFDGHPALGLCFDLGHAYCGYEDIPAVIHDAPDIHHVHVKDISDRASGHLVPGEGDIDLAEALAALDGIGFGGFVSVELAAPTAEPEAMARRSLVALMRWLQLVRAAA
ncbi:MAG: sugar phosphate isomerase/epimerase family protein [Rhodomicrobiaceae bacterium]